MGYFAYYLIIGALWYVVEHPAILVGIAAVWLFRRFIPDPWVFMRTFAHRRRLEDAVRANPANSTARRDLAMIYLERRRPKKALAHVQAALERDKDNAELLYLEGVSRLRCGDAEASLAPLVRSVELEPGVRFGDAYRAAGDALMKLRRHEAAIDAYEHFVHTNSSSIEGWTKLALAHRAHGEDEETERALVEARDTWRVLPRYKKRGEWRWRLRAAVARMGV